MISSTQLIEHLIVGAVRWGVEGAQHAHATGVRHLRFGSDDLTPLEVRRRLITVLDQPRLRVSACAQQLRSLPTNPREWSSRRSVDLIANCEFVQMLAWAGSLVVMPSWTAVTPPAWSVAAHILREPVAKWAKHIRLRREFELLDVWAQSGGWYWRTSAEFLRPPMHEKTVRVRRFAREVRALIPQAAKHCQRRKWFSPRCMDFPIGPARLTLDMLSIDEFEEVNEVCRGRCSAMRTILGGPSAECDADLKECWQMMFHAYEAPQHPILAA